MTTLYLVCLVAGTVVLLITLLSGPRSVAAGPRAVGLDEEMTVPGARIEPSDEYAVEGGAGGAEGEGGSPGYHDGVDGGVGGAEAGLAGVTARPGLPEGRALLSGLLVGFGGVGLVLSQAGLLAGSPWLFWIALVGGLVMACLSAQVVRFVHGSHEGK